MKGYTIFMKYNKYEIGSRIRAERENANLSQTELAEIAGVENYNTIGRWEDGKNPDIPPLKSMLKLCNHFNCDLEWLLCNPEYTCKRKSTTDIHEVTGLTEETINIIRGYKSGYPANNRLPYNQDKPPFTDLLNTLFAEGVITTLLQAFDDYLLQITQNIYRSDLTETEQENLILAARWRLDKEISNAVQDVREDMKIENYQHYEIDEDIF
jgi:transcriptional regulator with XRE-family HTH domain